METTEVDALVRQLVTGFEALQTEYQKLFGQYQGLERKLATAREQVSEAFALLCLCFRHLFFHDETSFSSRSVVATRR